jgi:flavin-dependent thymidylate synthase
MSKQKVELIDYTGIGWPDPADRAASLLIFTKQTRLTMNPGLLEEIAAWPAEKKLAELEYMSNSIPSSWEFVSYTFMIENVSRGFSHQFVRSRTCSFAQQSMRVTRMDEGPGWDYLTGPTIANGGDDQLLNSIYSNTMDGISEAYKSLIRHGAAIEDARGVLPTNILTNIVMKCNMRTFVELVRKRSSSRTQGEYRNVLEAMKAAVRAVHPWIDLFIDRDVDRAINDLEATINANLQGEVRMNAIKLLDQLRSQS